MTLAALGCKMNLNEPEVGQMDCLMMQLNYSQNVIGISIFRNLSLCDRLSLFQDFQ